MSAQECITAGAFQNRYRNACRFAAEQYFGSKFATVIVTGMHEAHDGHLCLCR
jgi:nuclear protein localization family protein 4